MSPALTTAARQAPAAARIARLGPAPQTIEDALSSQEARHWKQAIDRELALLAEKGVWTPTVLPSGIKPLGSRWLFQRKPTPQGIEYRARVVAKGGRLPSSGEEGVAAPSGPSISTLYFLLAYAHTKWLDVTHIRVEDPCLTIDLEDPIVIALPPRHKVPGKNALMLHKALYGLSTAPAAGLQAMRNGLEAARLEPIAHDPNLLVAYDVDFDMEKVETAVAMTYSGGVVVAGPKGYGQEVLDALRRSGLTAVVGPQDLMLGLTVRRERFGSCTDFIISQPEYVDRVVQRFDNVFDCDLPPTARPLKEHLASLKAFAGCLTWLTSTTHMELGSSAFKFAGSTQQELSGDQWLDTWEEAYKLLQLLKDDRSRSVHIRRTALENAPELLAAVYPFEYDCHYNIVIMLQGTIVQWYTRKSRTTLSATDLRWCAIAAAVKSLVYWRAIVQDIEPAEDAAIFVKSPYPLPTRLQARQAALRTESTMKAEGITFRDFPEADERDHQWCPYCCCSSRTENP